ncbi:hypothetical protein [Streptomyces sp. NPDC005438]|uniref:hypothetical protein n=1 Tax=Streptomyces sp. NPDC005438 TaxID=3156880 RepID=UPI0033BC4AFD
MLPDNGQTPPPTRPTGTNFRISLVCGARIVSVERTVSVSRERATERLPVARALLRQLRRSPAADESAAGFSTAIPHDLRVNSRAPGDPKEALRLNRPLDELPPFSLAQLACTLEGTAADGDHGVVLGGPVGGDREPVRRYECGTLKRDPRGAPSMGERVPSG